ncbi:MAG TPA: class E sortase [Acidimicrobiales bacterium]|jgi:sortase A
MIVVIFAAALILVLVGAQSSILTRQKRAAVAAGVAVAAGPKISFRDDPQGWMVDNLRRNKWVRRSLSIGSLAAFVFAVAMLGYPFYTNLVQSRIQSRLDHQLASPELKQAYLAHQLQDGDSLTRIKIPAIGVDVVVVQGTDDDALRAGAGHYKDTPLPCENGNIGIAGHRTTYGRPFADLDLLQPGDQITLETPVGSCTYQVMRAPPGDHPLDSRDAAFPVAPTDVDVVAPPPTARPGDPAPPNAMLTLTTCHPKGSAAQRLIVQAVLVPTPAGSTAGA